jgi:1,4-dihydroxy-2-naphthoate polyprenyltransferase
MMIQAGEPTCENSGSLPRRLLLATRPPFLLASLVAVLIGLATAYSDGVELSPWRAVVTLVAALAVHAAVNLLNDYYDSLNGCDERNQTRLYPFTGGSRFIQNGVLTRQQILRFAQALLLLVAGLGLLLTAVAGSGLLWIGLAGMVIGWGYSAPPLQLNHRGWGEIAVAIGFGLLIPLGSDYVQRGELVTLPLAAGLSYAVLTAMLLYINQFPDYSADKESGKHHWVVRLGPQRARWGYPGLLLVAYGWLLLQIVSGVLPLLALLALVPAVHGISAARSVLRFARQPQELRAAIVATIAGMLSHGLLLALALVLTE